ncbi:hypothetical protein TVAGG3_0761500 [Trichomonas vaginalis G3]|nr:hypothetical protein TVAGG3_0761500 [Trichomonas vaginalis G3]KAI5513221.1 hypothetical protein TVAGG3_0761500 [Trichomonas vaginalis G3]
MFKKMSEEEPGKVEPKKISFSLKSDLTIRALASLGIKEEELSMPNLSELKAQYKTTELANKVYQRKIQNRNDLIDKITEQRKNLQSEGDEKPLKADGTILKEKRAYEFTTTLIEQKNETNNKTLKRLAINQLRHNYIKQKTEDKIEKCNEVTATFTEKRDQTLSRAYTAAQTRTFATVSREQENPKLGEELAEDMQKHLEMAETKQKEIKDQYKNSRNQMDQSIEKGRERSTNMLNTKKDKTQKKIDSYEKFVQNKSDLIAQQKQKFVERGQTISDKGASMRDQNTKRLEELANSRREYTEKRMERSQAVLEAQNTLKQQKIAKEKARLEKMTDAANKIFEGRVQKREDFRSELVRRDEKLTERIQQSKNDKFNETFEKSLQRDEKIQQARRNAASRQNTIQQGLLKSILRDSGELSAITKQRAKSELELKKAEKNFGNKRRELESALRDAEGKPEEDQIKILMKVLAISKEEAQEIVTTAKQPY